MHDIIETKDIAERWMVNALMERVSTLIVAASVEASL
jgi:hypothetical protein